MSIVVVGSVALDSVETPFGQVTEALGGSASYFSLAAGLYSSVQLVAAVGNDFPPEHIDLFRDRGIDLDGLQIRDGRTFRWSGRYDYDLNHCETLDTQINVFGDFRPQLPQSYRDADYVFLGNIDPDLQLEVLGQVRQPVLKAMDTMNYWIESKYGSLTQVVSSVDVLVINEAELREYARTHSLVAAARHVLSLGPKALVVKKGEYGAVLFTGSQYFVAPAYPLEEVRDPTGAGDSFAGGFVGFLAREGTTTTDALRRAIVHGSVIASFTVEDFGVGRLLTVTPEEVACRYQEFRQFTYFEH